MKRQLEKEGLFKFYIKRPLEVIDHNAQRLMFSLKMKMGYWYCEKCQEYHAPRVVAYAYDHEPTYYVCSLGIKELENSRIPYERVRP